LEPGIHLAFSRSALWKSVFGSAFKFQPLAISSVIRRPGPRLWELWKQASWLKTIDSLSGHPINWTTLSSYFVSPKQLASVHRLPWGASFDTDRLTSIHRNNTCLTYLLLPLRQLGFNNSEYNFEISGHPLYSRNLPTCLIGWKEGTTCRRGGILRTALYCLTTEIGRACSVGVVDA